MAQPKLPQSVVRKGLIAIARGATVEAAAVIAGCSERTLWRRLAEEPVVVLRERKQRDNALSLDDRFEIQHGVRIGETDAAIATRIGRHRSTIWREINANGGRGHYRASAAQARADQAARRCRPRWFEERPWLWAHVRELLETESWSPEAIAAQLREEHPGEPQWWVSHEAIYQAIYVQARGELKKELIRCLRTGRTGRKPQGRAHRGGAKITGMVNISERPAEAADRAVPGHWEGDLIVGANNRSYIATLVERVSRYGLMIKLESKHAEHVAERIGEYLSTLPKHLARSLTWDQGTELADHQRFTVETGVRVYFCDPHSPWQRPSNEHWNGQARFFVGHGNLRLHSQEDLDTYARKINGRPRKIHGWKTAAQVFAELVASTA